MIFSLEKEKGKLVAVLVAAAFFFSLYSCLPAMPKKDLSIDEIRPVFLHQKDVIQATVAAPVLFQTNTVIRPRSFSSLEDDYVYWDADKKNVIRISGNGRVLNTLPLDAAFVWVQGKWLLARKDLFTEKSGFQYCLYELRGKKLVECWSGVLDCFPSDVMIESTGTVFLCGGNYTDTENTVYRVILGGEVTIVLRVPKENDFLRLINLDDRLLVFASAREKKAGRLSAHILSNLSANIPLVREITFSGLPQEALSPFGYGFAFNGDPVLPITLRTEDIALARFSEVADGFELTALTPRSGGCFLPIATGNGSFWYLAHDSLHDPSLFSLARYDGESIELTLLK